MSRNYKMSDEELHRLLKDYYAARDEIKEMQVELMAAAVERGMRQDEAIKSSVSTWLDGYLQGNGFYREMTAKKWSKDAA